MHNIWQQLSKDISEGIAQAGRAIVAVDGRNGHTSSGIIWQDSLVLTAAHGVRPEAQASVILQDGRRVRVQFAGRDQSTDIAVLKSDESLGGPNAEFGATTSLAVGELVVAIGRTRRGNIVASSGILSGLMGEFRTGRTKIDQFIRPDLMLYPGFSGGALLDASGKILGMNTSGLLRGKPLSIPASTLTRVAQELAAKGHVARPYIGLVMQPVPVPESMRKQLGTDAEAGLLVMHVEPRGPAESAGVILGDVLLDLDGQQFDDIQDLQDVLQRKGANQDVKAVAIRGGQRTELTIRIGERPLR
jgi:S1-C subfamily serine protease